MIVTARTEAKGANLIKEVKRDLGVDIEVWPLDLMSLKSVREFVAKAKAESVVFNIVLNNAGVMAIPYSMTKDGYETQLQVNYISPALLFKGLLDNKSITDKARIVVVTSIAAKRLGNPDAPYSLSALNWDSEEKYNKWGSYAYAKGAVVMHCNLLAKRLSEAGSGITVNSVHPGGISTGLQSEPVYG